MRGSPDNEGLRLARKRSELLEEASQLAGVLASVLRDGDVDASEIQQLSKRLHQESVELLERATSGRVQSRITTKVTGHPLLEGRKKSLLFLDESGTAVVNSPEPIFSLGGVAINEEDCERYVQKADELKRKFFKTTNVTFHEPHMRKRRAQFYFEGNTDVYRAFDDAFRDLVGETDFVAFGVAVRKSVLKERFLDTREDPYLPTSIYDLAIMLLLERYVVSLASHSERRLGRVHLESIGPRDDALHQASYAGLLLNGTQFVPQSTFQSWLETGCRFAPKEHSSPAELADLVAREVYEWVLSDCAVSPKYWDIISSRFSLVGDGHFGRFGLKVFPSDGLEVQIYSHRERFGASARN